jgi:hypothetical protein
MEFQIEMVANGFLIKTDSKVYVASDMPEVLRLLELLIKENFKD